MVSQTGVQPVGAYRMASIDDSLLRSRAPLECASEREDRLLCHYTDDHLLFLFSGSSIAGAPSYNGSRYSGSPSCIRSGFGHCHRLRNHLMGRDCNLLLVVEFCGIELE